MAYRIIRNITASLAIEQRMPIIILHKTYVITSYKSTAERRRDTRLYVRRNAHHPSSLRSGGWHLVWHSGRETKVVNFNDNLNEDSKNIYSIYYSTVARRVIEKMVTLPLDSSTDGFYVGL